MSHLSGIVIKRSFSASSVVSQLVKAPVQVHGVEGRYATALYSAATKQNKLENVEKELNAVKGLFNEHAQFKSMVLNPTIKRQEKKGAMHAILQKLGHSDVSQNFFDVVAENGRLVKLEGIFKSFEQIMRAHRGEVFCEVTTAKALDAATSKQLTTALEAFVKKGEKLSIHTKVDPSIVGGMIVKIGDKYVDMSLNNKIKHYKQLLDQAV
jgi:F-type H+-transporting ATPase subunit O